MGVEGSGQKSNLRAKWDAATRKVNVLNKRTEWLWKPENSDKNILRVFTYRHTVNKADIDSGYFSESDIGSEKVLFKREVLRNFSLHPKKIPVFYTDEMMAEYARLSCSKDPNDRKLANMKYKMSTSYAINIIDMNDIAGGMKVWLAPKTVIDVIEKEKNDPDKGDLIFGLEGRDFRITKNGKALPKNMYSTTIRDREMSVKLPSKVLENIRDLFDEQVYSKFASPLNDNPPQNKKEEPVRDRVGELV